MLPFQSNVGRDIKKNFNTKTLGPGLSASHSQDRESSDLGITGTMTTALQSTDAESTNADKRIGCCVDGGGGILMEI